EGGQFALWRFMVKGLWWQAHPYTISGLPQRSFLRLTVKGVGDHSQALASLERGTPVAFEGPYGVFTAEARRRSRVALIAAGAGVTSLRPVLEELPAGTEPVVILRASRANGMPLRDEVAALVDEQGGTLHELYGSRRSHLLDGRRLRQLVPDIRARDVYVSGPADFVDTVTDAVRRLGVPTDAVHHEAYAL
ncbi:MAG: ferredoxin reductase domain-containing protein, partial [Acidimicrobiales bacterium]